MQTRSIVTVCIGIEPVVDFASELDRHGSPPVSDDLHHRGHHREGVTRADKDKEQVAVAVGKQRGDLVGQLPRQVRFRLNVHFPIPPDRTAPKEPARAPMMAPRALTPPNSSLIITTTSPFLSAPQELPRTTQQLLRRLSSGFIVIGITPPACDNPPPRLPLTAPTTKHPAPTALMTPNLPS
jgi:hypothetical protein